MQLLGLMFLLLLMSCGKSNSNAGMPIESLPLNGSNIEGIYMAEFDTLNDHVNGDLPGSATLQRRDDKFFAYVRLFGGAPNAWHQQNIHLGRCPVPADDTNGDGFIDIQEAKAVIGPILIPLDSNLSSQDAGKNVYPIADSSGSYFYERVTSFEEMFSDLKAEDNDLFDNLTKLAPTSGIDFNGQIVVIHGAPSSAEYPDTVATEGSRPAHQTLPIACGVFKQVRKIPGEPLPEEEPGPVGDTEVSTPDTDNDTDTDSDPVPRPRPEPREDSESDDDDRWYDRIIDWWRNTWERDRRGRGQTWGRGDRD